MEESDPSGDAAAAAQDTASSPPGGSASAPPPSSRPQASMSASADSADAAPQAELGIAAQMADSAAEKREKEARERLKTLVTPRFYELLGQIRFHNPILRAHYLELMCEYGEEFGARTLTQWTHVRDAAVHEVKRHRGQATIEVLVVLGRTDAAREILEPGYYAALQRNITSGASNGLGPTFLDHANDRLRDRGLQPSDSRDFRAADPKAVRLAIAHLAELGLGKSNIDDQVYLLRLDEIKTLETLTAQHAHQRDGFLKQIAREARAAPQAPETKLDEAS
jgi:hypothetical protein